jgi:hypothetical protein
LPGSWEILWEHVYGALIMDPNRKQWNDGQQKLRTALMSNEHQKAVELFLIQHGMVHSR